jgi:hypothetical protein
MYSKQSVGKKTAADFLCELASGLCLQLQLLVKKEMAQMTRTS